MIKNKKPIIIGIQGAAGVGKTSVARKLCKKLQGRTVRISVDILRDMSCVNFLTMRESDEHILMAKRVSIDLAKAYLKEGSDNIIVEFAPPVDFNKGETDKWLAKNLRRIGGSVFLLHASLEEVLKRNKNRRGEFGRGGLSKKLTERLYRNYEKYIDKNDFEIIDTEKIGADKTTSIILEKII